MRDYKQEIITLLDKIENTEFLRFIWIIARNFASEKRGAC